MFMISKCLEQASCRSDTMLGLAMSFPFAGTYLLGLIQREPVPLRQMLSGIIVYV